MSHQPYVGARTPGDCTLGTTSARCLCGATGSNNLIAMRLELIPVPVADIDSAKSFYVNQVGFNEDHDVRPTEGVRVVQLTPPGSSCSIVLGAGLPSLEMPVGSLRALHLVVDDIRASRDLLLGRGVEVGDVIDMGGVLFAGFSDPDGNTWTLQQTGSTSSPV